ncbi:hypothetical protein [Actinomadura terrae]|uniref:hypothetical protein n=1 Tax=Actinomadura terrae TaxID=604353 RepID=UPI001FA6FDEB|nr:hypothetical protein [Actinomadura terrae]
MRMWRTAALPLVLALALTGCGSDDGDEGGVASVAGAAKPGQSGAAAPGKSLSPDERNVKFAECMRQNGVPMDDPKPGQGIQFKVEGGTKKETVDKAMAACRKLNPQSDGSGKTDQQQQERVRKFAECMRKNGVESFADPKPGQQGIMIDKKLADDPEFNAAQEKCKEIMAGGGPGGAGGGK